MYLGQSVGDCANVNILIVNHASSKALGVFSKSCTLNLNILGRLRVCSP